MARRGLLLDRDGVINVDHGYVGSCAQFAFIPGLFAFLRTVRDCGYVLAILTNQSGVARGLYTETDYDHVTSLMLKRLEEEDVLIDLVLASFEHRAATIAKYRRDSFWRKPRPGMVLEALLRLQLDPERSAFIGDNVRDMDAAAAGGIKRRLFFNPNVTEIPAGAVVVNNYDEALKVLNLSA